MFENVDIFFEYLPSGLTNWLIMGGNTEDVILKSAREIFILKGFDGARMQEIADRAGINKALLHYYFRSKKQLFDKIFGEIFFRAVGGFGEMFQSDLSFREKVKLVVSNYIGLISEYPLIPNFIITELSRNPEGFYEMINKSGFGYHIVFKSAEEAMAKGEIPQIDPKDFLANIISMCVFPFMVRPLMQVAMFNNEKEAFDTWIEQRKQTVFDYLEAYLDRNQTK